MAKANILIELADAVVAELNATTFSQAFSAKRSYRPRFDRKELASLRVSVVPVVSSTEVTGRAVTEVAPAVEVAVQKAIDGPEDTATIDGLMGLLQEVQDHFLGGGLTLASGPQAACIGCTQVPGAEAGYSVKFLDELHAFTGIVRFNWKLGRRIGG